MTNPNFTPSRLSAADVAKYLIEDYKSGKPECPLTLKTFPFTAEDIAEEVFKISAENRFVDDPDSRKYWDGVFLLPTEEGIFEVFSGERGGKHKLKEFTSFRDALVYKIAMICKEAGGILMKSGAN